MQVSGSGSVSATQATRTPSSSTKAVNSSDTASQASPAAQVQLSDAARNMKEADQLPYYLQPLPGYVDPHASSGIVFDYLKVSDQKVLQEAYDYAVENGTDKKKVDEAAFYLASQRSREAKIAAGTKHVFHVSDKSIPFILAKPEDRAAELEKIASDLAPTFLANLKRAEAGHFFGTDNPVLNKEIFTEAVDQSFGPYRSDKMPADRPLVMPDAPTDPESLLMNHLSGADKSELSRAYQHARDNDLDPDEVRKAALLLAVDRMNNNMAASHHEENSTAYHALKASAGLFEARIDTPNKLIELAEKVLGEDAADSFRQMVGQPAHEDMFGRNSILRQTMFLAPAYNLLNSTFKNG